MLLNNLTKSSRFSKNVVPVAFILIGIIAVYNWLVAPHRNYLLAAQKYESAADNLARKNQIIAKKVKNKTKELDRLQEKFQQSHARVFGSVEARRLFSDIPVFAQEMDCVVDALEFLSSDLESKKKQPGKNSGINTQRAKLSVVGCYGGITALMNKLQERLEQVQIESLNIKQIRQGSSRLKCDMTITINVIQNKERGPDD